MAVDLLNGLVSYYKLDETSGSTAYDELGNNNLTTGGGSWDTGKINNARKITGNNDYLTPSSAFNSSNVTFSLWFYYQGGGGWRTIIAKTGGTYHHLLIKENDTELGYYSGSAFVGSGYKLSLNNWYHIVVVKEGTNQKIYVNNDLKMNNGSSFNNSSQPASMIGNYSTSGGQGSLGVIDEVGVWNRALNTDEISELYNNGDGLTYPFTPPIPKYTLTINKQGQGMDGGIVTITPDQPYYEEDDEVTITASVIGPEYKFDGYTGDLVSLDPIKIVTMDSNKNITANFDLSTIYELNVTKKGQGMDGGTVTILPQRDEYYEDEVITLQASANGITERFHKYEGDIEDNPLLPTQTIHMDEDKNIDVYFQKRIKISEGIVF